MSSKQASPGCLVLFGLVFAVMGSIPGCVALYDMSEASAIAGWTQTTAVLLDVGLDHGEDTLRVTARYRYRAPDPAALEGGTMRDYEGDRVGIHGGSDNIGDWQQATHDRLQRAWQAEEPVPCWYDPADPAQAVLDRDERSGLLAFMFVFPLVFGLVGGGLALFGFVQWRKSKRPARTTVAAGDAPAPPSTPAERLVRADRSTGIGLGCAAIFWNAISWTIFLVMLSDTDIPWPALLFGAIFPLVGIFLLYAAVLAAVRGLRHGRSTLRLDDEAWSTGARVRATVLTRTMPQPGDRIAAKLAVLRSETTGSGKNRRTVQRTLWSLDLAVDAQAGEREGAQWAHHIELPLPSDQPQGGDDITWRLEWQLVRPGPDLNATFNLPVTAGHGELLSSDIVAEADRAAPLAVLEKAGVRIGQERGEVLISLPPLRNPSLYVTGAVCCLLLTGGAVALFLAVSWLTAIFSAPLLLLCWRGALRSAFWRARLVLGKDSIAVESGWLGLQRHEVKTREVIEVERHTSMSSNDVKWYNLWLKTGDGARIAIARGVPEAAAARIAELIEAVLPNRPPPSTEAQAAP